MSRSYSACDHHIVYRVARRSRLESCLSFAFIYPFRCKRCSRRFRAFRWGVHYDKVKREMNRRQEVRHNTSFPVTFLWRHKMYEGTVTDIALSGCQLQTDVNLIEDHFLKLVLEAPGFTPGIRVDRARVRGARTRCAGLNFLEFSGSEQTQLRQFLLQLVGAQTGGLA